MRSTLRNFCKLGLTPARSSDPKKKGSKARATTRRQRQRRDREETEKRQRRDREETEKRQRRDREETEKRQRRDREETEKRQRRDREETEKRQRRDREETERQKEKERCGRPSTISLSSALHVFQVTTQKKRKVRSTLRNFCQLGPALARGSDPYQKKKKSAVDPPQFLEARPGTCSKFFIFFSPCPAQAQKKKKRKKKRKKNEPTSLKSSRVYAQLNDGF